MEINSQDYTYILPEDRIALHPLKDRDQSKLLVYKGGVISHQKFSDLPNLLPNNATLFFNDTRVIPARIYFTKGTGARIEVFLLNPVMDSQPVQVAMLATGGTNWLCTIGNLKKWKEGAPLTHERDGITLAATLKDSAAGEVEFSWTPSTLSFAEIVEHFGHTPLPPYLHREANEEDKNRYQTVYSHHKGAVAAPTAGLHFSKRVINQLVTNGLVLDYLTLHVSAGTFQPIKTANAFEHPMHAEQIIISRQNIDNLLLTNRKVIAVGTTSMRTLESLYWYGVKLLKGEDTFNIAQNEPYLANQSIPTRKEALEAVKEKMGSQSTLMGQTSIFMVPGYKFRVCDGLITNFHQPGSTLMLLVAAFVGSGWKSIYETALRENYRFLSYGDSSLLLPE